MYTKYKYIDGIIVLSSMYIYYTTHEYATQRGTNLLSLVYCLYVLIYRYAYSYIHISNFIKKNGLLIQKGIISVYIAFFSTMLPPIRRINSY